MFLYMIYFNSSINYEGFKNVSYLVHIIALFTFLLKFTFFIELF